MQSNSTYYELSVANKWISLTRKWLEENAPCSREFMFMNLSPLMPGTVRRGVKIETKEDLVREAFRRIFGTADIPSIINKPPEKKFVGNGTTEKLRRLLAESVSVDLRDVRQLKNSSRLLCMLVNRGEAERIGKGVYKATGNLRLN